VTRRPTIVVALLLAAATHSAAARAAPKLQAVGETTLGYTDNIQSAPDTPLPGGASKSAGEFLMLSPGVVLAYASGSQIHRLKYVYSYNLYFQSRSASSSSNRLEYGGFFDLSPRVSLLVGAAAVQSNRYSAILFMPPGAGTVNALPSDAGAFLSASADETVSVDLSPDWRTYETARVAVQTPLFDTVSSKTVAPGGLVGIERTFERNAVGAEARVAYSIIEGSVRPDGTVLGVQRQIIGTGVALWRHDWSQAFTSRVEAGALRLQRLNTGRGFWHPTGTAALTYTMGLGEAELSYSHTATNNPLMGQTLLLDTVTLRGGIPLTKKGDVVVAAASGYKGGQLLDEYTNAQVRVDALLADVGIGWQVAPSWLLALRAQHFQQWSDARVQRLPVSYSRNSILASVTFQLPPDKEMPQAYRAPRRVDRTDELRDTLVPDDAKPPGQSGGPGS
jgi:hypothetical protein